MQLYIQTSQFVDEWRVKIQNDERGQFINVNGDGPAGAYLSLDVEGARALEHQLRVALDELETLPSHAA